MQFSVGYFQVSTNTLLSFHYHSPPSHHHYIFLSALEIGPRRLLLAQCPWKSTIECWEPLLECFSFGRFQFISFALSVSPEFRPHNWKQWNDNLTNKRFHNKPRSCYVENMFPGNRRNQVANVRREGEENMQHAQLIIIIMKVEERKMERVSETDEKSHPSDMNKILRKKCFCHFIAICYE